MLTQLRSVLRSPRLRGEAGWVVIHKLTEFAVMFVTLKLFTNLMPRGVYGEYSIALTALALLANLTAIPVAEAYYRSYHAAETDGNPVDFKQCAHQVVSPVCCFPLSRMNNNLVKPASPSGANRMTANSSAP